MREISNEAEFQVVFEKEMKEAIDSISKKILDILITYIRKDIYDADEPYAYQRTWQFLNSWINQIEENKNSHEVIAEIFSDIDRMDFDPSRFAHGSYYSGDFREHLSEAIENRSWI